MEQLEERDAEIAAVGRVLDGGGGGLLIEGPPGIGKTRLLEAARALADGRLVLSARGSELERDFPFAVVRQLLEPVARDEHFAGAAALAQPVLRGVGGEQDAGSALHGLYWLAANLAESARCWCWSTTSTGRTWRRCAGSPTSRSGSTGSRSASSPPRARPRRGRASRCSTTSPTTRRSRCSSRAG